MIDNLSSYARLTQVTLPIVIDGRSGEGEEVFVIAYEREPIHDIYVRGQVRLFRCVNGQLDPIPVGYFPKQTTPEEIITNARLTAQYIVQGSTYYGPYERFYEILRTYEVPDGSDQKSLIQLSNPLQRGRWTFLINSISKKWAEQKNSWRLSGRYFDMNIYLRVLYFHPYGKDIITDDSLAKILDQQRRQRFDSIPDLKRDGRRSIQSSEYFFSSQYGQQPSGGLPQAVNHFNRMMGQRALFSPTSAAAKFALKEYQLQLLTSFALNRSPLRWT